MAGFVKPIAVLNAMNTTINPLRIRPAQSIAFELPTVSAGMRFFSVILVVENRPTFLPDSQGILPMCPGLTPNGSLLTDQVPQSKYAAGSGTQDSMFSVQTLPSNTLQADRESDFHPRPLCRSFRLRRASRQTGRPFAG